MPTRNENGPIRLDRQRLAAATTPEEIVACMESLAIQVPGRQVSAAVGAESCELSVFAVSPVPGAIEDRARYAIGHVIVDRASCVEALARQLEEEREAAATIDERTDAMENRR